MCRPSFVVCDDLSQPCEIDAGDPEHPLVRIRRGQPFTPLLAQLLSVGFRSIAYAASDAPTPERDQIERRTTHAGVAGPGVSAGRHL